jgi:adenylate cyclase
MMQAVRRIQETVDLPGGHLFDIRIGVNTGDVVVGNMGSQHRFSYTVMGDDVNREHVLSRLTTTTAQAS